MNFYQKHLCRGNTRMGKILLVMRLIIVLLTTAILQVSATGYAQRVTLSERNASLELIFQKIKQQTGYDILYQDRVLSDAKNVTLTIKDAAVSEAIEWALKDQPLMYSIEDKTIIIKRKEPSFLDNLISRFVDIDVRGRVVDEKDEPLIGATVKVKGTGKMTKTNGKGEFYLTGVDENATLEVFFLGYKTRELKAGKDLGVIKMEVFAGELEEVKVTYNTGYETVDRTRATGSFVKVDSALINRSVSTNIIDRLEGIAPGLLFDKRPATLGGPAQTKLQLRGVYTLSSDPGLSQIGTYTGADQPLIVVDNFPFYGDFNAINPLDVEDVTILRDAAAASIWGARAGNGVIVITTKKAKYNQAQRVMINSNVSITVKPRLFDLPLMSASETIDLERLLYKNGFYDSDISNTTSWPVLSPVVQLLDKQKNSNGTISDAQVDSQLDILRKHDLRDDYLKYVYRDQVTQSYQASFSVGSSLSSTLFSVGHDYILAESIGDQNGRLSFRINNNFRPSKKLNIQTSVGYTQQNNDANGMRWDELKISGAKNLPIYTQLADEVGGALAIYTAYRKSYLDTLGGGRYLDWTYKPLEEVADKDITGISRALLANINVGYDILRGLKATVAYQYDYNSAFNQEVSGIELYGTRVLINTFTNLKETNPQKRYPVPLGGIMSRNKRATITQGLRSQLNFNRVLSEEHEINVLAGVEAREAQLASEATTSYGYNGQQGVTAIDYVNVYPTIYGYSLRITTDKPISYREGINRFISYYANASYTYKKRYTLFGSARNDAANIFGVNTNQKGRPFWSVGAAWRLSAEGFYEIPFLSDLILRSSYGYSGNIDPSVTAEAIVSYNPATSNPITGVPFSRLVTAPNPDLRWEKVGNFNIGLDFSTTSQRIRGSIDYYRKKSVDVITTREVDLTTGMSTVKSNSANMKGSGVDLMLTIGNFHATRFKWYTTINYSYTTVKVSKLKIKEGEQPFTGDGLGNLPPRVGRNPNMVISYQWAGLDPANGNPRYYLDGKINGNLDDIYNIKESDLVFQGPSVPPHYGNILNIFSYRGIQLSANITYQLGYYFRRPSLSYSNLLTSNIGHNEYGQRWQKPGDETITDVPSFVYPSDVVRESIYQYSTATVERGDHIHLNDLDVVYTFPQHTFKQRLFKQLSFKLNVSDLNILIWRSNKKGLDPVNVGNIPPSKRIALGFNASF